MAIRQLRHQPVRSHHGATSPSLLILFQIEVAGRCGPQAEGQTSRSLRDSRSPLNWEVLGYTTVRQDKPGASSG
jgi:hypothetical protein